MTINLGHLGLELLKFVIIIGVLFLLETSHLVLKVLELGLKDQAFFLDLVHFLTSSRWATYACLQRLVQVTHLINSINSVLQILVDLFEPSEIFILKTIYRLLNFLGHLLPFRVPTIFLLNMLYFPEPVLDSLDFCCHLFDLFCPTSSFRSVQLTNIFL